MGNNYDIILIGLVAVFLILRLRSVLGKRTGNERPPARDPFTPPPPPPPAPRVGDAPAGPSGSTTMSCRCRLPMRRAAPVVRRHRTGRHSRHGHADRHRRASPPSAPPIPASIRWASRAGARAAFTAIVEAFAKDDIATLRPLLDGPTFASFEAAIRGRPEREEKAETTLIGFEASDIAAAELQGTDAVGHRALRQRADQRGAQRRWPDRRRQSRMKCRRSSISGHSVATPSPAIPTGC